MGYGNPYKSSSETLQCFESKVSGSEILPVQKAWGWLIFIGVMLFVFGIASLLSSFFTLMFSGSIPPYQYYNPGFSFWGMVAYLAAVVTSMALVFIGTMLFLAGVKVRKGNSKERVFAGFHNVAVSIRVFAVFIILYLIVFTVAFFRAYF